MKKITLFAVLFFLCNTIFSQSLVNNNWYFGDNFGLTFNNGNSPISQLNDGQLNGGQINTASVSDQNGNLLFYTDGVKIWNKNHLEMPNGQFNGIGVALPPEKIVIIPDINDDKKYYIFTAYDTSFSANDRYYYSVVDMNLDSGNGDLTINEANIFEQPVTGVNSFQNSAKRIAYYHDKDLNIIWITLLNDREILTYKIDNNGFDPNPVQVSTDVTFDPFPILAGSMKISPDGTRIAMTLRLQLWSSGIDVIIADFDSSTGIISNPEAIAISSVDDIEFSPDSNTIYFRGFNLQASSSKAIAGGLGTIPKHTKGSLFRCPTRKPILSKASTLFPVEILPNIGLYGSLQLGLDNKIYFNNYDINQYVGVIHNPNDNNTSLNIEPQLITFNTLNGIGNAKLPREVIDLGKECNGFPKEFVRNGGKQNPYEVAVDNNDDIILMNVNENTSVDLDGVLVNDPYFIAKYTKEGCLLWTTAITSAYSKVKVDDNNNIYILSSSSTSSPSSLIKYSPNGSLLWSLSIPNSSSWRNLNIYGDYAYISGSNSDGFFTRIFKIDVNSATYVELNTNLPQIGFSIRQIFVSDTTNEMTVVGFFGPQPGYININSFNFGTSTIISPSYDPSYPLLFPTNKYLLKYNLNPSFNMITPVKGEQINTIPDNVYYSELLNRIFIFNPAGSVLESRDHDYNLIGSVNSMNNGRMNFKQSSNTASIIAYYGSSIDLINLQSLSVNNTNLSIPNIGSLYASINHDQDSSGDIYVSWVTFGSWNMNFQKIDPITGDLLNRTPAPIDGILLFEEEEEEEEVNSNASIYPNPFNSQLTIKQNQKNQITQVLIYGKLGNILVTQKVKGFSKTIELNTSKLSRGLYFVKTFYKDGTSETKQIIKE